MAGLDPHNSEEGETQSFKDDNARDNKAVHGSQSGMEGTAGTPESQAGLSPQGNITDGGVSQHADPEDETQHCQDGATEDLEATPRIGTGRPIHSVFGKHQKHSQYSGRGPTCVQRAYKFDLTSYMIFQGIAPTIFGDLADMTGRRPTYFLGFVIYIVANIGLALQNSYASLFLLRCLQSSGSSGTIALGNGVVADIASSSERGTYMGFAIAGPMIGPAVGPILGGLLSQFLGWRAIFWFLAIMAVAYLIPFLISFPETGRNVVGNGSIPPPRWNMSLLNYLQTRRVEHDDTLRRTVSRQERRSAQAELASKRKLRWPNPLRTIHIIFEKDVGLILLYNSLVYTAFYDVAASLPSLFAQIYGFNDLQIGLSFIPFGVGCFVAAIVCGKLMDFNYRRVAKRAGISIDRRRGEDTKLFPIEKARLQVVWPLLYVGNATILCYGWVLEQNAPLAAPLILQFIMGLCLTSAFNVMSTLLVDLYPLSPATATAANNLVRCLMGAAGTAVIIQMVNAMGRGWCFTFIAAVVFFASPMLWVVTKYGPMWREERRVRGEMHAQEKRGRQAAEEGQRPENPAIDGHGKDRSDR